MDLERLEVPNYALYYTGGRFVVKLLYWIGFILLLLIMAHAGAVDGIKDSLSDPGDVLKFTTNALTSPEGFLKFQLFAGIASFPVIVFLQWEGLIILIFALTLGIKLITRSKDIIGCTAVVTCGFSYFLFLIMAREMNFSIYSSFSLTSIIMFFVAGIYLLCKDRFTTSLSMLAICMIGFGGTMIWIRNYQLFNHTLQYSGFWMLFVNFMINLFLLRAYKELLCESEEDD